MAPNFFIRPAMAVAAACCFTGVVAAAQSALPLAGSGEIVQPDNPVADELAAQMRILGRSPNDVSALVRAGELALALGDATAAARLFARAERLDPGNARLKAGEARALVHLERPGEALSLFAQAQSLGANEADFAADLGLAYDLVGQQTRAQRAYRLALSRGADDETARRYALSLGISGQRDAALKQIDAQVRRSDRAAWRVRAFILAMTGDAPGANRIAVQMLPSGLAGGLEPFFDRLGALGPVDKAFAVHFGEVTSTPERVADARLAPTPPPLTPEFFDVAPVPVQERAQVTTAQPARKKRRNQPDVVRPPAPVVASNVPPPLPAPPREVPEPDQLADSVALPTALPRSVAPPAAQVFAQAKMPPSPPQALAVRARPVAVVAAPLPTKQGDVAPGVAGKTASAATANTKPTNNSAAPVPRPLAPLSAALAENPPPKPVPMGTEESILGKIVAGIGVPASELGVGPQRAVQPLAAEANEPNSLPAPAPAGAAAARLAASEAGEKAVADKKALAAKVAADKLAADKKTAADKKLAEKKAADKAAASKKAAEEKAAKASPSRVWVQVAGGASVRDLPKAWGALKAKAPALLKARQAWTTPLRFTNRLLTGPFASAAQAQAFVNALGKAGVSGFVFTSDKGQEIARLPES